MTRTDQGGLLIDRVRALSHDHQLVLLDQQSTKALQSAMLIVSMMQEHAITSIRAGHQDWLHELIEDTYIWATITTILRKRGEYGHVIVNSRGRLEVDDE